jgi:flagellar biosynthesis/type III secretory pathway protein FliH
MSMPLSWRRRLLRTFGLLAVLIAVATATSFATAHNMLPLRTTLHDQAEVRAAQTAARAQGHAEGAREGYADGLQDGRLAAPKDARVDGLEIGRRRGLSAGMRAGFERGYDTAYERGRADAYGDGRYDGYARGFATYACANFGEGYSSVLNNPVPCSEV